jgi:hypothetical protein
MQKKKMCVSKRQMSRRGTEKFFADVHADDDRRACDSIKHAQDVLHANPDRTYAWFVTTRGRRGRRYACKYQPMMMPTGEEKKKAIEEVTRLCENSVHGGQYKVQELARRVGLDTSHSTSKKVLCPKLKKHLEKAPIKQSSVGEHAKHDSWASTAAQRNEALADGTAAGDTLNQAADAFAQEVVRIARQLSGQTGKQHFFINFSTTGSPLSEVHINPTITHEEVTFKCKSSKRGCPSWDTIQCTEKLLQSGKKGSILRVKSTCFNPSDGRAYPEQQRHKSAKVFVWGFESFKDYLRAVATGTVSLDLNKALWRFVFEQWTSLDKAQNFVLVNHNRDVNTLHFKFEPAAATNPTGPPNVAKYDHPPLSPREVL